MQTVIHGNKAVAQLKHEADCPDAKTLVVSSTATKPWPN